MTHRYLDVMTIRSSNGASKLCQEGSTSLLIEPIHLPEMVHVQVDPSRADTEETRFFYATGEKNPNLDKHIENAFRANTDDIQERYVRSTVESAVVHRSKPSIQHIISPQRKKEKISKIRSMSNASTVPKPKEELYHRKKPDRDTQAMISSFRKNEQKLASIVGSMT